MKLCYSASNGVNFSCQGCGHCCSGEQEGYVYVYMDDILQMQTALQLSLPELASKYLSITTYDYVVWDENLEDTGETITLDTLILNYEPKVGCFFLHQSNGKMLCKIYSHRPIQCQLFPFWNLIMQSEIEYLTQKASCPGFQDHGKFYSASEIEDKLRIERKIEYEYVKIMKNHHKDIYQVYPFLRKSETC